MTDKSTLDYVESLQIKADIAATIARQARESLCERCGGRGKVARLALVRETYRADKNGDTILCRPQATIMDVDCPECREGVLPKQFYPVSNSWLRERNRNA